MRFSSSVFMIVALLSVGLNAAEHYYDVSQERINALPVIPKSEPKGILAGRSAAASDKIKEEDRFEKIDLSTHGNEEASVLAGLNTKADRPAVGYDVHKRPRIGLVLSGGGARGGAHLGIIKTFEKYNIPIDGIVGTSMGSFVGGLYASGMSTQEIERELTTLDWTKVITFDYDRSEIPFRRKKLQQDFPGNAKVGVNQNNEIVLGTGLFKRQSMLSYLKRKTYGVSNIEDFDELRIPFRAVASRLEDGNTVILKEGSLPEAIYASIAIPGGFDPITINGEVLVDGGVADNLPVDVMRKEMAMDYIVVVDISTPYDEHAKFDNYLSVMGQLVNILMRKNVDRTVESMQGRKNEILVRPDLSGYGSLDADKYPQIIAIGDAKGEEVYNSELSHLSLYERDYYSYLADRPIPKRYEPPLIDSIEIENGTYLNDTIIRHMVHIKPGEKLDHEQLENDIADIYNLMIFDDVDYKVVEINGKHVLKIITTPSWDINGQIKFAFGFEDNFNGHSDYSVKLEYIKNGLNTYGGEWRNRLSFGMENLVMTELYQPVDPYGEFYIRPALYYRNKKVYVSPSILADHTVESDLDDTFVLQAKEYGAVIGLGANLSNDLRLEVDGVLKNASPSGDFLITDTFGSTRYVSVSEEVSLYKAGVRLDYDSLDHAFFPRSGTRLDLSCHYSNQFHMQDADPLFTPNSGRTEYAQYTVDYAGAFTLGRHTFAPHIRLSETFDTEYFENSQDFGSYATLGGLFNLSGLPTNALTGNNLAFASLVYRYRLTDDGFFGALTPPTYVGLSVETGDAWYSEDLDPVNGADTLSTDMLKYAGSVYVAADTIIGPFYLGAGTTEYEGDYYYSFYLSLGKSF